jgi:hypothetical protein
MAVYSRFQLRDTVAEDLKIKDAYSALSSEDADTLDKRIQSKLEELSEDGLIPFDLDGDAIPAAYLVPLSRAICPSAAPAFGLDSQKYESLAELGMRSLYRLKAKPYFGAVAPADFF